MPLKNGRLTSKEDKALAAVADGESLRGAAIKAGYENVDMAVSRFQSGALGAEFTRRELEHAERELIPIANARLKQILESPVIFAAQPRLTLQAVELAYKRHDSLRASNEAQAPEGSEMSPAQLRARIESGQLLLAAMQRQLDADGPVIEGEARPVTLLD